MNEQLSVSCRTPRGGSILIAVGETYRKGRRYAEHPLTTCTDVESGRSPLYGFSDEERGCASDVDNIIDPVMN